MTSTFDPTYGIRDTSKNCKNFVKDNFNFFIYLLVPLSPFMFISDMINDVVQHLYPKPHVLWIFSLILMSYFNICLAVAWHRAVIWGTHRADRINPLNPDLGIFKFAWVWILFFLLVLAPTTLSGLFGVIIDKATGSTLLGVLIALTGFIITAIITIRISIIFPSVATEGNLRIRDAYALSKGLASKLFFAPFWALLPMSLLSVFYISLITFLYFLLVGVISGQPLTEETLTLPHVIAINFVFAPATVFLNSVILVLGVTVLSNYYQWAVQKGNSYANPVSG